MILSKTGYIASINALLPDNSSQQISPEDIKFLDKAWVSFIGFAKKESMIAGLIRFHPLIHFNSFLKNDSIKMVSQCKTVWLDCEQSLQTIINNYSLDIKKRVLKAKNDGIVCDGSQNLKDLMLFAKIYLKRMKSINAGENYLFDDKYFKSISELNSVNWRVYLVKTSGNQVIGGALIFLTDFFCNIHLSSSLKEYFNLSPNIVLRDTIIKDCLKLNIKKIHFGGGRTLSNSDSLLNFKKKFSKETVNYFVGGLVIQSKVYDRIIQEWNLNNLEKLQNYKNFFLKYRF